MPLGLYGKYPAKRDYVAVNVPRSVLQPLENWLAAGLATSRDRLGRKWQEHYMVQPVWNFRLGAAVAGIDCLGVIAPSVDGVGRAFPLAILAYGDSVDQRLASSIADADIWQSQARERLMLALSDTPPTEPAGLLDGLPEASAIDIDMLPSVEKVGDGYFVSWNEGGIEQASKAIDAIHINHCADHRTVWWCNGSPLVAAQIASFDGFPDPEFMVRMMSSPTPSAAQSNSAEG